METLVKEMPKAVAKTKRVTGSEALMLALVDEGVDTIFGYPGGAIMPIYDELYKYEHVLKHFLVRHEQGATHAAQGYSRVSGKTGVCFATSGPGATNLITGIADAQIDSTPLVCITGQVSSQLLGTAAFQETDIVGISMPVTKWNFQVTRAEEIPYAISRAFYIANSGRPGPVLIDITKDAQFAQFDFSYEKCKGIRSYTPVPKMDLGQIEKATELINQAKKPYILAGHGITLSGAIDEFRTFAEKGDIPVGSTLLGISSFPTDHRLNVGMLGMHGNYGANIKTNECDVLIAVGMRFDDRVTGDLNRYAKQAKVIHIEIDPSEIDKNVKAHVPVIADAREALIAITERISQGSHGGWLQEFRGCDAIEKKEVIDHEVHPEDGEIKMAEVIHRLSEFTNGEAIIVTDVGQHQMVASRYYRFKNKDSLVTSGGLGTMGFGLPAALGAKIAKPERDVIVVIGDGGFQMTIQELGTIFQYKIPVKILVLNNKFLGMVRQWQQLFFDKRYSATEMTNPDFVKIAEGYSLKSERISERENLDRAIEDMLSHQGPYFLEVEVENEHNVFPMIPSGKAVTDIRLK